MLEAVPLRGGRLGGAGDAQPVTRHDKNLRVQFESFIKVFK
jgi:hypothetical protein